MIRLRWFLLLLALATVFAAWRVWWVAENRSAESLLRSAEARLDQNVTDHDAALNELELALKLAREAGDRDLAESALRRRAQVNLQRSRLVLTLNDCDALLEGYSPGDAFVLDMAARSAFGLGEYQRAADYAQELVEVRSDEPRAFDLLAKLHRALAEEALLDIQERLKSGLPTRLVDAGLRSARRAAALPANDPHARAAFEELDALSRDEEGVVANRALTERARAHLVAAREAWIGSLSVGRTGEAIEGLQELLARGGLLEEVVTLGTNALRRPHFPGAGGVLVRTALAQAELNREDDALRLISEVQRIRPKALDPAALADANLIDWLVLAHDLELWRELEQGASEAQGRRRLLRNDKQLRTTLSYLRGVALLEQKRTQAAMLLLSRAGRYVSDEELVEGEQVLSWTARSIAERRMGQREEERRSIFEVTRARAVPEPDGGRAARAYGEALERQSQLSERAGRFELALDQLAQATAYLPDRRLELEGRWRRLGEQALESSGYTLQQYRQLYSIQSRAQPGTNLNSWATVELANNALANRQPAQAITVIRRRLGDLPYFAPLL